MGGNMLGVLMLAAERAAGIDAFGGGVWSDSLMPRPRRNDRWDVTHVDTPKAKGKRAMRRQKGKKP